MKMPLEQISVSRNVRLKLDEAQDDGLKQTMQLVGQQVPARGRMVDGKCVLTDGMRRFLAARKLGWRELEVIIDEDELDEGQVLQRQLITNCQRADLPTLDKARAISRLMEVARCNATQAASSLGMSNATVTRLLTLLTLPKDIQLQIESGKLAASTAYELARTGDPTKQAELARAASAGQLSRDETAGHVKRMKQPRTANDRRKGTRAVVALADGRTVSVASIESSLDAFIACLEEALNRARRSRTKGHSLATFCKTLRDEAKAARNDQG